jgi:hypothetical protein
MLHLTLFIKALSRVMETTEQLRLLQIAQRGAEGKLKKQQGLYKQTSDAVHSAMDKAAARCCSNKAEYAEKSVC